MTLVWAYLCRITHQLFFHVLINHRIFFDNFDSKDAYLLIYLQYVQTYG